MSIGNNNEFSTNNEIQRNSLESRIDALQNQISKDYKISVGRVGELVKFSGERSRKELMDELKKVGEFEVSEKIDYDALADKIAEISKLRENTRESIAGLRVELPSGISDLNNPNNFLISKWFKKETLERIQNPKNIKDQFMGLGIGALESVATTGKFVLEVPLGLFKTYSDGKKIAKKEAEYDGFDKV